MNGILPPLILIQIQVTDQDPYKVQLLEGFHNLSSQHLSLSPLHSSHMRCMLLTLILQYLDFIFLMCFVNALILKIKIWKKEMLSPGV